MDRTDSRVTRGTFLKAAAAVGTGLSVMSEMEDIEAANPTPRPMPTGPQALAALVRGNGRVVRGKPLRPNQSPASTRGLTSGQSPFAILLSCSDSRVPSEPIFDQGFGDLFVVRVAGNIADSAAIGSIEYAVAHFHTNLIMVLGHQSCGAVDATVRGGHHPGHIPTITKLIEPAAAAARRHGGEIHHQIDFAITQNAKNMAKHLIEQSSIIGDPVRAGKLLVVSARYQLTNGSVSILTGSG